MTKRFNPVLIVAFSALATAALAQTGGSMSGPAGAMSNHMAGQSDQGCTPAQNHMASGAMSGSDHMSGADHMSGGSMSGGNHMAGGAMSGGDHMSANHTANTNCQTDQTTPPKH